MPELNKLYECKVTDLTVKGEGVAKVDSYPLFIKDAVPGDVILAKTSKLNKNYGFANMAKLLSPSTDRRVPPCKSFAACGGCNIMQMNYKAQLEYKSDFVLSNICKIASYSKNDFVYEGILGADEEFFYRNKAQFPVKNTKKGAVCGFYEQKSHNVVASDECYIQNNVINLAVQKTLAYINSCKIPAYNEEKHTGVIRHIYVRYCNEGKNLMVVLVTNSSKKLPYIQNLVDALLPLGLKSLIQNVNTRRTNVVLGEKNITLYGDDYIHIQADDLIFKVSPHSFFQVNVPQMKKLYSKAIEYASLTGCETVFDLYCGVGSISLFMAKKAKKVIGVEIVPQAIENAKENASLSGVENTEFYCGDCTQVVNELIANGESADVVVVDPPRKGCDEKLLELINSISPKKLVYVSCNSATLARDLAVLKNYGYLLKRCTSVDLFPQTCHVEAVALLQHDN